MFRPKILLIIFFCLGAASNGICLDQIEALENKEEGYQNPKQAAKQFFTFGQVSWGSSSSLKTRSTGSWGSSSSFRTLSPSIKSPSSKSSSPSWLSPSSIKTPSSKSKRSASVSPRRLAVPITTHEAETGIERPRSASAIEPSISTEIISQDEELIRELAPRLLEAIVRGKEGSTKLTTREHLVAIELNCLTTKLVKNIDRDLAADVLFIRKMVLGCVKQSHLDLRRFKFNYAQLRGILAVFAAHPLGKKIRSLDLSENNLGKFINEISSLPNLEELDLSFTKLEKIGADIGNLQALSKLDLSYNLLLNLPAQFARLTNLRSLNIAGNKLVELPLEICSLINLEQLDLHNNCLTGIPNEILDLVHLVELDLSSNRLSVFPAIVHELPRLQKFRLCHCAGSILDETIEQHFLTCAPSEVPSPLPVISSSETGE